MKKTLKLIPALAMLLVSAILVSTSTYAWFSMNTQVSATNMQVRAVAEKGLLINEVKAYDNRYWDEEATAAQTSGAPTLLYPTSTANGTDWYHGASKKSNSAAGAEAINDTSDNLIGDYEVLSSLTPLTESGIGASAVAGTNAERIVMGKNATDEIGYYVQYKYYLKSASGEVDLGTSNGNMNVVIKSVSATLPDTKTSENLDPSIRVGIKMNSTFYIFAPVAGYTDSYWVYAGGADGSTDGTPVAPIAGNVATATDLDPLPAANASTGGAEVDVFIWYEGEDENCKSDNAQATTLDNIKIDIVFALDSLTVITGSFAGSATSATLNSVATDFYKVGDTNYYADTATYTAGTTKFYTIDSGAATPVANTVVYS